MALPLPRSRVPFAVLFGCLIALIAAGIVILVEPHRTGGSGGIGGPFALVDQNGRRVTQADVAGHPFLVFFGYTHCPDVCPTTLSDMSQMLDALGKEEKVKALFVTIDPERDTPAVLKDYLSSFDPRIEGLTGDPEAIKTVEKAYRVYAKKVPTADGDYSMDHTAIVYLMDGDGRFISALNLEQSPKDAAAEVRRIL
jgi:protein SCO1/2